MGFLCDLYIIHVEAVYSVFHRKQFDILLEVKTKTNTHFSAVKWVFILFIYFFYLNMIFLLTVQ